MRILLDEIVDARALSALKRMGHDVSAIAIDHPASLADRHVLAIAQQERRILITLDRDFGELVFAQGQSHAGVIFLRLGRYAPLTVVVDRLDFVLTHHADQLDQFLVVTRDRVRVR